MKKFSLIYIILLFGILLSCSLNNSPTSGGVDVPNGLRGKVIVENSASKSIQVVLMSIEFNDSGYRVLFSDSVIADSNGNFYFHEVKSGNYLLLAYSDTLYSGIKYVVAKSNDNELDSVEPLSIKRSVVIKGRVLNGNNSKVFIPGTNIVSNIDENGFYILKNVPQGKLTISILDNGLVYNLPCIVDLNEVKDTIYVQDLDLLQNKIKTDLPHNATVETYLIYPKSYPVGLEPEWYKEKDFSLVDYVDINFRDTITIKQDSLTVLYVEEFPEEGSDTRIIKLLTSNGIKVVKHPDSVITNEDLSDIDVIFISYTADGDGIGGYYKDVEKPVIAMEFVIQRQLALSTGYALTAIDSTTKVKVVSSDNFITKGLSGVIEVMNDTVEMGPRKPAPSANIILTNPEDTTRAILYTYEKGDMMIDSVIAKERRVGFSFKNCAYQYNDIWAKILINTIKWASGIEY